MPIGTAECSCLAAQCQTSRQQQGCSPSRRITAARGMQNKAKQNKVSRKHTVEKKVRSASGDSRSQLRLNRQTGVLIFPSHKDFFVIALRKQIQLLPQENNNGTRAASKINFPHPVKMQHCNAMRQEDC